MFTPDRPDSASPRNSRRSRRRGIAAGTLAALGATAALVIAPGLTQAVPTTTCNGTTLVADVTGNVSVPHGAAPCHVAAGVTITGNIVINAHTALFFDGAGVTVGGNVTVKSDSLFQALSAHDIGGNVTTDGGNIVIQNGHVDGFVDVTGSTTNQNVSNETVDGDLRIFRVRTPGTVLAQGNTIGGSVTMINNTAPVTIGLSAVTGDVTSLIGQGGTTLWQNTVSGSMFAFQGTTLTDIAQNTIAGDLVCDANVPAPTNDFANPNNFPNNVGGSRVGQCDDPDFEGPGQEIPTDLR
jgi:hypothetical protein